MCTVILAAKPLPLLTWLSSSFQLIDKLKEKPKVREELINYKVLKILERAPEECSTTKEEIGARTFSGMLTALEVPTTCTTKDY